MTVLHELDSGQFGTLLHVVLASFGRHEIANSTNVEKIHAVLNNLLDQRVLADFGENRLPAVNIQVEQIRLRLQAFAIWQANQRKQGWQILYTERLEKDAALDVDGQPMGLRGRIDRIDLHADGRYIVFDYKTGDSAKTPEQAHRKNGQWIDLQLPLYRHLIKGIPIDRTFQLGYILLPRDTSKIGAAFGEWDVDELADADRAAERVAPPFEMRYSGRQRSHLRSSARISQRFVRMIN